MRTVYVQELMRLPLGKQGENGAARIVWQGLAARYQALYGSGAFTLTAKRCGDAAAYPVAVSTEGGDVVWLVRAADVASPGSGSCELTYTVDGAVAKSQTWSTYVAASISGDAPGDATGGACKAWFAAIQAQIGNLDDLTTKARQALWRPSTRRREPAPAALAASLCGQRTGTSSTARTAAIPGPT